MRWEWAEATLLAALRGYAAATGVVAPAAVAVGAAVAATVLADAAAPASAVILAATVAVAVVAAGREGPPSLSIVEPRATLAWLTPAPPAP